MKKTLSIICTLAVYSNLLTMSWGAFGTYTLWQVQATATAANANGGGFDYGNANFATDLACTSATGNSPSCSSASYTFVSNDIGSLLFVQGGTNFLNSSTGNTATAGNGCWFPITGVSGGSAQINAAIGAAICTNQNVGYPSPRFLPSTVAGVASVSTPTGGVWGVDYSQSDTAPLGNTDLATTTGSSTPCAVTSAASPFGQNVIGNALHILSTTTWSPSWREIVSVSGSTATLDAACASSMTVSSGTWKIGGAISLGSSTASQTDQSFIGGTHMAAGHRIFIKGSAGALTIAATITGVNANSTTGPIVFEGYNSVRGDQPAGSNRPAISLNGFNWATGGYNSFFNISATGTNASVFTALGNAVWVNNRVVNSSTTISRNALAINGSAGIVSGNELVSYHGTALAGSTYTFLAHGNYIHDSDLGITSSATSGAITIDHNLIASNVSGAIRFTGVNTFPQQITNNTIVGVTNQFASGNGIQLNSSSSGLASIYIRDNIFYGFSNIGVWNAGTVLLPSFFLDQNDFYNNATDVTGIAKGPNGLTVDPQFVSLGAITGSSASSSTNVLTDGSANFSGVVDGQDFAHLISGTGTGFASGKYLITAHTTTTLTLSSNITTSGSGTAITYQVMTGHNFAIQNSTLKSGAFPGTFPGGLTTGYAYLGAVGPQGSGGGQVSYAQ